MSIEKCLCCGNKDSYMVSYQSVKLCSVCRYVVSNKLKYNFQNRKSTNVLDIIKEINNWNDKDLYNAHLSLREEEQLCI